MESIVADGMVRLAGWDARRIGEEPGVPWPVSQARLTAAANTLRRVLLHHLDQPVGSRAVDALRLAAHHFAVYAAAVAEVALAVAAESQTRMRLEGAPEIEALRSGCALPPFAVKSAFEHGATNWRWLRRTTRVASWSSIARLPRALIAPDAVAITHNGLLRDAARHIGAIGFRHADEWLAQIVGKARRTPSADAANDLAEAVAAETAQAIELPADIGRRVQSILSARLRLLVTQAWRDLCALEQVRLPARVWSGTGGFWPARAIGIEVMRRGGDVRRFDHGSGHAVIVDPQSAHIIELCVSTTFVVSTAAQAAMLQRQLARGARSEIVGGGGDPRFNGQGGPLRKPKQRPRVMYATGPLLGFRKVWPMTQPDFSYLDWQLRVARALAGFNVDLVLKPHPEGLYRGRKQPLAVVGPVENRRFEDILDEVDAVVFDYPASTTFWVAVASRCPVILLDTGMAAFDPAIASLIEQRVRLIPAPADADGRRKLDIDMLAHAIFDPAAFDHTPFQRLFSSSAAV